MKLRSTLPQSMGPGAPAQSWLPRLMGGLVWLVAGYAGVFWALQWNAQQPAGDMAPVPVVAPEVDSVAVARALGGGAPVQAVASANVPPNATQRMSLHGVLSSAPMQKQTGHGVALIAVDGQKAKPYPQGAVVDGQWVVRRVEPKAVVLAPASKGADDGPEVRLELAVQPGSR